MSVVSCQKIFASVVLLLFSAPLLVIIVSLFTPYGEGMRHLADTVLPIYISNTIWIMLGVGALSFILGAGTAWLVTIYKFSGRKLLSFLLFMPLAMPAYIAAFIYGDIFEYSGFPIRSLSGAVLVLSFTLYPYVYMLCRVAFSKMAGEIAICRTMGMSMGRLFVMMVLPAARPAVVAGIALVLMEAIADFGAVQHLAVDTFTTGIYRTFYIMREADTAAKLAAFLMIFVFAVLALERISRRGAAYYGNMGGERIRRIKLTGFQNIIVISLCITPIILGFIIPVLWLFNNMLNGIPSSILLEYSVYIWNSVKVSGISALIASVIALVFAYLLHNGRKSGSLVKKQVRIAAMGYAIPGTVVAVAMMIIFGWLDNRLDAQFSTGLILSGTVFALIFAYVFRFLAVALGSIEPGMMRITCEINWSAQILGCKPAQLISKIHMPILSKSFMVAALLVFVEGIKELPATLVMRPFNFDTLATRAYMLASDERLTETALPALIIVAVASFAMMFAGRKLQ